MEQEKKVKLLVYATEDERTRIKMAAARLHMSMSSSFWTASLNRSPALRSWSERRPGDENHCGDESKRRHR